MSKKKNTETEADSTETAVTAPPAAVADAVHAAGATALQVTTLTAALLTSPRYASCVKDPREQDRVVGIALAIANKINQAV